MSGKWNSGDAGYCHYAGCQSGIVIDWDGDTVVGVHGPSGDCQSCSHAGFCKLYRKHPVGFVQEYPASAQ